MRGARLAGLAVLMPLALSACGTLSSLFDTSGSPSVDQAAQAQGADQQGGSSLSTSKELRLARAARSAGDLVSAVNLYRSVLASRPKDDALAVELGDTLLELGAIDDAIGVYSKIGDTSPARVGADLGLGRAQIALHQPAAALAYFDSARSLAPNDPKVLLGRGVTLDLLDRHEEAQASYREVLNTHPRHVAARNDLALSLALTGDYAQAVSILSPIALSPIAPVKVRQNLALIYGLEGNSQRAAQISRLDLSEADTEANLRFFEAVREHKN